MKKQLISNKIAKQRSVFLTVAYLIASSLHFYLTKEPFLLYFFMPFIAYHLFFSFKHIEVEEREVLVKFQLRPFFRKVNLLQSKKLIVKLYPKRGYWGQHSIKIRKGARILFFTMDDLDDIKPLLTLLEQNNQKYSLDMSRLSKVEKRVFNQSKFYF